MCEPLCVWPPATRCTVFELEGGRKGRGKGEGSGMGWDGKWDGKWD